MREGRTAPPLAGRGRELLAVVAALAERRSLLVLGPGGIGKTTLVRAGLDAAAVDAVVLRGMELARSVPLLPLRAAFGPVPGGTPGDVAATLAARLGTSRLVVDDLHACDPDTLDVLLELELRTPLLVTTRPEAGPPPVLASVLADRGACLELGPLDDGASRELIQQLRPGAMGRDVEAWVRRAGGVPLLLRCLVDMPPGGAELPVELAAFASTLSEPARCALARATIAGGPVPVADLEPGVDELRRRGLVEVDGGCARIVHDLIGAAALDLLDEGQRRRLHRQAAERAATEAEAARHLVAAGDPAGYVLARRAAAAAETPASRADLLALAASAPDVDDATVLDAVAAAVDLGRYDEGRELLEPLRPGSGMADPRAEVLLATCEFFAGRPETARAAIERGLARTDVIGTEHEVLLLVIDARLRARVEWDPEGAARSARRAVDVASRVGGGRAAAHGVLGSALLVCGDPAALDHLERAVRHGLATGDVPTAATAADTLFVGRLLAGDASASLPLAEELGAQPGLSPAWQLQFRKNALLAAVHVVGDYERVLDDGPRVASAATAPRTRSQAEATVVLARADTGDDVGALDAVEGMSGLASTDATTVAFARWCAAEAHWLAGRPELAVAVAGPTRELPVIGFPAHVLALLTEAWARQDLGRDIDPGLPPPGFPNLAAAAVEHEALRRLATEPATAEELFLEAAARWLPGPRWRSRALLGAGMAARAAGRPEAAVEHLLEAERLTEGHRLVPMLRRIRRELRRSSVRRGSREPVARSGLTATEEVVLGLAARGMTQPAVARHLAVGTATVRTHLASARRKLGARTALQAAAAVLAPAGPPTPRFVVATTVEAFEGERDLLHARCPSHDLDSLRSLPHADDLVGTATVRDVADAARVVAVAHRCRSLAVLVADAPPVLRAALVDNLRRLGPVVIRREALRPGRPLDDLQRAVLDLLAAGRTVAEAAQELHVSRRTLERRLATARAALGVHSNVEAVARHVAGRPARAGGAPRP